MEDTSTGLQGAPHATATSTSATPLKGLQLPPLSTSTSPLLATSHYLSVSQAAMTSVAARRALFEKLGEGSARSAPHTFSSAEKPAKRSVSTPSAFLASSDALQREINVERDGAVSPRPVAARLAPAHTGSTVASTAVEQALSITGSRTPDGLKQSVNRVRLAVMAYNARDPPSKGESVSPLGARLSRSWSRMSGVTQINEDQEVMLEGAEESLFTPTRWFALEEASPVLERVEEKPISFTWSRADGIMHTEFDTHPPDMISPRTVLANVIHPRLRKMGSQSVLEETLSEQDEEMEELPSVVASVSLQDRIPSSVIVEEAVPAHSTTPALPPPSSPPPSPSPLAASAPAPSPSPSPISLRRNTPIILRGQGHRTPSRNIILEPPTIPQSPSPVRIKRLRPKSYMVPRPEPNYPKSKPFPAKPHARSHSVISTTSSVRPLPIRAPTSFQHHRRTSSIVANIPVHDGPLALKALNALPLRKVGIVNAPKPMRFSMAL